MGYLSTTLLVVVFGIIAEKETRRMDRVGSGVRKTLSDNLSRLMAEKGWTGKDMQKKSGVSDSTVDNIRRDAVNATVANVSRLASAFNMPAWALLIPGLDVHASGDDLDALITRFIESSDEGRIAILRLALSESNLSREKASL